MKKFQLIIFISLFNCLLIVPSPVSAQSDSGSSEEPYSGDLLCLPDAYLENPGDCLPLGPSVFLTKLAENGVTFPLLPLPAIRPDPQLIELSLNFAKINLPTTEQVPVYGSLSIASTGGEPLRYLGAGVFRYIAYTNRADVNGGHYLQLQSREWVRASPGEYSEYQGLIFHKTPQISFGWIWEIVTPHITPGINTTQSDITLPRETVVPIYNVQEANGTDWYMVDLNQWVERHYIRPVDIHTTPPEGVDNNRWIEINLYNQTLTVYEDSQLIFATMIASGGDPYFTRPGLFQIYEKLPFETMSGSFEADHSDYYYLQDVPWTMYFDKARAIHGAYWRANFGLPQTHGCVNLSIGDSHWLYDWAEEGEWVYVWDPSGETPTDPVLYTDGGF